VDQTENLQRESDMRLDNAKPFRIAVPDEVLVDLHDRLRAIRWTDETDAEPRHPWAAEYYP
jgi:hypothetical protein